MSRRNHGFTLLEVVLSSALLSVLVLAAATASQSALTATGRVATLDAASGRSRHALGYLRQLLVPASTATLQGIPAVGGQVPENMQDGVAYADLQFRTVGGFAAGVPVLRPALGQAAWRVYSLVDAATGRCALWFDNGTTPVRLLDDIESATFRRTGKHLTASLVVAQPGSHVTATFALDVALLSP